MMGIVIGWVLMASSPWVDSSRVIVRFYDYPEIDSSFMVSFLHETDIDGEIIKVRVEPFRYVVIKLKSRDYSKVYRRLEKSSEVKYVEPTVLFRASHIPNDVHWDLQWGPVFVHAPDAWDITTGDTSIAVAVVDQGVQYTHPDLDGHFGTLKGYDFVDDDSDPAPVSEVEDHGTHVAGIIAAEMDNYIGIAGMAQVRLYSLRVLNDSGVGSVDDISDAIIWAANHGVRVINMSLGAPIGHYLLEEACQYAVDSNVVLFAAAGNAAADSVDFPARYETVVAVGAIDPDSSVASYSNHGPELELSAPGTNIYSTLPFNSYGYMSGTSMATPLVSGVAALVLSRSPRLTNQAVRDILASTAMDFGPSGRDFYYGYGVVDAYAAVQAASNYTIVDTLRNDNGIPYYYCANEWGPYIKATKYSVPQSEKLEAILAYFGTPSGYSPTSQTGHYYVWADESGHPGALIASGDFDIPALSSDQWIAIDLSTANVTVSGDFWLGISQSTTSAPYLRQDNSSNPTRNLYSTDNGTTWNVDSDGNYFIRAVVSYRIGVNESDDFEPIDNAVMLSSNVLSRTDVLNLNVMRDDVNALRIVDISGRVVVTRRVTGKGEVSLPLSRIKSGVYFLIPIAEGKALKAHKIVVR